MNGFQPNLPSPPLRSPPSSNSDDLPLLPIEERLQELQELLHTSSDTSSPIENDDLVLFNAPVRIPQSSDADDFGAQGAAIIQRSWNQMWLGVQHEDFNDPGFGVSESERLDAIKAFNARQHTLLGNDFFAFADKLTDSLEEATALFERLLTMNSAPRNDLIDWHTNLIHARVMKQRADIILSLIHI